MASKTAQEIHDEILRKFADKKANPINVVYPQVQREPGPIPLGQLMPKDWSETMKVLQKTVVTNGTTTRPAPRVLVSGRPETLKFQETLKKLADGLPYYIATKIDEVALMTENNSIYFLVTFKYGSQLSFADVDSFPTDADIARIALMAP